ncbi:hypothetical protein ABKN59_006058 [Abortiporus biennis]
MADHQHDVGNMLGLLLIACMISAMLYGGACVQIWQYFNDYKEDKCRMKIMILVILLLDTASQALFIYTLWSYFVVHFGDLYGLKHLHPSLMVQLSLNGVSVLVSQIFFAVRIWGLSQNLRLTAIVAAGIFASFGLTVGDAVTTMLFVNDLTNISRVKPLATTMVLMTAATDCTIAGSMYLLLHRSQTGFKDFDCVIRKLIIASVRTCLLTGLFAVFAVISLYAFLHTMLYVFWYFLSIRLYSNCVLSALNARKDLRHELCEDRFELSFDPQFTADACELQIRRRIKTEHAYSGGTDTRNLEMEGECHHGLLSRYNIDSIETGLLQF